MTGRRILIVEDEMLIALMLQSMLEALGHRVTGRANTVASALAMIETDAQSIDAATLGHGPIKRIHKFGEQWLKLAKREFAMARFDLTDFEWSVIQPLLPNEDRGFRAQTLQSFRLARVARHPIFRHAGAHHSARLRRLYVTALPSR